MIHGVIYICPECRKIALFKPNEDGTFNVSNMLCADDGYLMRAFYVDSLFIDGLLKGTIPTTSKPETPNAT